MPENEKKIKVAILEDHQSTAEGYMYRLGKVPEIEIVASIAYGEELEPALAQQPIDVFILDINTPTSESNSNPYPILHVIPKMLQAYPQLTILIISMHAEKGIIRGVMEAGANGYILKDDRAAVNELGHVIKTIAGGGVYFSQKVYQLLNNYHLSQDGGALSPRQLEALSLCAAYPDALTSDIARRMNISNSTVRNMLSGAYVKLDVRTRAAAIAKAQSLGLITPLGNPPLKMEEND